jgi:ubiquinone/menaquinone biosynthesis C-methylase UbiE
MGWTEFEDEVVRYEGWYVTPKGQRVARAERALLTWLLASMRTATSLVEIGCGTGHFTRWLRDMPLQTIGLDRSPAMLNELRRRSPDPPAVLADAHALPLGNASRDLVLYVTALEFLEEPTRALTEAVRVARQGVLLVVLNRWSAGGVSRRWGTQRLQPLLGRAHDYSLGDLRKMLTEVAGARLREVRWRSALLPGLSWRWQLPVPLGDILGCAALLSPPESDRSDPC